MKRAQRPQRAPKPRPAPPAQRRKAAMAAPRKAATTTPQKTATTTPQKTAPATQSERKPTQRSAASEQKPAATTEVAHTAEAPSPEAKPAAERPPRRGLGNLGLQSLHRAAPTITLAVERPRAMAPTAPSTAARAPLPPPLAVAGGGATVDSLLVLREGLHGLLRLLDAPPEAAPMGAAQ